MSEQKAEYKIEGRPATIFRTIKSKDNPYVMIDRRPVDNPNLSFKAKGILTYLLSRPDGWEVNQVDLAKRSTDGLASVKAGVKELQKAGHLRHQAVRNSTGQIISHIWEVYEVPQVENRLLDTPQLDSQVLDTPTGGQPEVEKPQDGFTTSGESHAISIKYLSNKELSIENDEKQKLLRDLEYAGQQAFGNNFTGWRALARQLENASVNIHHEDGCLLVTGLGMKAAMFQDRYARSFSNALAGIYNHPTEVMFEE